MPRTVTGWTTSPPRRAGVTIVAHMRRWLGAPGRRPAPPVSRAAIVAESPEELVAYLDRLGTARGSQAASDIRRPA